MASILIKENIGLLNSPVEVFYKKIYYSERSERREATLASEL